MWRTSPSLTLHSLYEEFTRLAETRLPQNSLNLIYLKIYEIYLKIALSTLENQLFSGNV